jgi:hypothetical protein
MLLTVAVGIQIETLLQRFTYQKNSVPAYEQRGKKIRIAVSLLKPDAYYDVSRLEVEPIFPDAMFYFCSAVT